MYYNNSNYKSSDIDNINKRYLLYNYFNPYEYNLESNLKDKQNMDLIRCKSLEHEDRRIIKNK